MKQRAERGKKGGYVDGGGEIGKIEGGKKRRKRRERGENKIIRNLRIEII